MDNPRILLAIALSFLVLLIWQAWMEDYGPQPKQGEQAMPTESRALSDAVEDLPHLAADRIIAQACLDATGVRNRVNLPRRIVRLTCHQHRVATSRNRARPRERLAAVGAVVGSGDHAADCIVPGCGASPCTGLLRKLKT